MNNVQENKVSMYLKVRTFLQRYALNFNGATSAPTLIARYNALLDQLLNADQNAVTDITGYTVVKQQKRTSLRNQALRICRALQMHFATANLPEHSAKISVFRSSYDSLRDTDFYTQINIVFDLLQNYSSNLAQYGFTNAEYEAFENDIDEFLTLLQLPKDRQAQRSAAGQMVDNLMAEMDLLLETQIDNLVGLYEFSDLSMYLNYQSARSIDQTGTATPPDYTGSVNPASIKVVAEIPYLAARRFEIENQGEQPIVVALSTIATEIQGTPMNIAPGDTNQRLSSNLNTEGNFLLINNPDPTNPVPYRIWVVE